MLERVLTERAADRGDEFHAEIVMAIGEQVARRWGQAPVHGRAATTGTGCVDALNQFGDFEGFQVLANCGVGEAELGREFGSGRALGALQTLDDAALGTGEVAADVRDALQSNGDFTSASLRKSAVVGRG